LLKSCSALHAMPGEVDFVGSRKMGTIQGHGKVLSFWE
jgi:hypothetical protein